MKVNILAVILACIISSFSLYSKDKLIIATIVTDKTLATNKTLRIDYLSTLNQYAFIKHKSLFGSDVKKYFYAKKSVITTNDAFKVASNINADFVLILDVVTTITNILHIDTNTNTTNTLTNTNTLKQNYYGIITNRLDMLTNTNTNAITNTNTNTNQTLYTNTSCTIEVFEPSTGNSMRFEKYENVSTTRESLNNIAKSFESYLADKILESIKPPDNDININLSVERRTIEGKIDELKPDDKLYNGDSLSLKYDINKDGYLYIMLIQAAGPIVLLYPNEFNSSFNTKQIPIVANKKYSIPDKDDVYRLNVSSSQGKDRLYLIYTSKAQKWFDKDFEGVGFKLSAANTLVSKMNAIKKSLDYLGNKNYQIINIELDYYYEPPKDTEDSENDKANDSKENKKDEKEKSPLDKRIVIR